MLSPWGPAPQEVPLRAGKGLWEHLGTRASWSRIGVPRRPVCPPPCPPQGVVTVPVSQRTGPSPCPAGGHPGKGSCCLTGQRGCCGRCFSWTLLLQTLLELGAPTPFPLNHLLLRDPTPECIGQELPAALWLTRARWCPSSRGGGWGEEEPGTPHPQPMPKPPGQVGGDGGDAGGAETLREGRGPVGRPGSRQVDRTRLQGSPWTTTGGGPRRGTGLRETTGDGLCTTQPRAPSASHRPHRARRMPRSPAEAWPLGTESCPWDLPGASWPRSSGIRHLGSPFLLID